MAKYDAERHMVLLMAPAMISGGKDDSWPLTTLSWARPGWTGHDENAISGLRKSCG